MNTHLTPIRSALDSLNSNYGRGSIESVCLFLDGHGEFMRKPFQCCSEKRSFRIKSGANRVTVFALGHQKTISA